MSAPAEPTTDHAAIRRTILLLAVCGFAASISNRLVDPMVGAIARDLGADPLRVALLSSAYALPYAFIQPILGPLGDALGKERIIKVVLLGLTATLAAASLASDLPPLFVFRVLSGACAGGVIPLALATIGDRVAMAERQVAIGRFLTASISGQLIGGAGGGILADTIGWRGALGLSAALAALAAVAVTLGFRRARVAAGRFSLAVALERYRRILAVGRARALMLFVFSEGILIFGVLPFVAPILEANRLGGPTEAGIVLGAFAVGGIVFTMLIGLLLRFLGLGRMLVAGGLVLAAAFGALAPILSWPWQAAAMLFVGLGFYMLHSSFQTQMTEVVPEARGSAVALHAFAFFVGQALGPIVIGAALGPLGHVATFLACAAGLLALGFAAAIILVYRPRPPPR